MSIEVYAALSYLFTAAISLFLMGVIVTLNKLMPKSDPYAEENEGEVA